jgi:polyphosphate kinase
MAVQDLGSPELYINRELSWLEFDDRVLRQGCDPAVPLMERLKFLAITSSNLDEFFMIRVGGLKQQVAAGVTKRDFNGLTPQEQLEAIADRAHRLIQDQTEAIAEVARLLDEHGLHLMDSSELDRSQRRYVDSYFGSEVLPVLTPLAADELEPFPALPGLQLNLAVLLRARGEAAVPPRLAIVPVPDNLPRFTPLPAEEGLRLVRIEQVIADNLGVIFPDHEREAVAIFRLTRDADVAVDDEDAADLLQAIESAVRSRRRGATVRLSLSAGADPRIRRWLADWCDVGEADIYEVDGMLDPRALMKVAGRSGFDELRDPPWPPMTPPDIAAAETVWEAMQDRDMLLFHPYDSFEPVVSLLDAAADDPNVLAIKQTLYRTSGNSPIVAALARAAESGKQVTVLVELKARFDEANNANWARRLEDAGCHVIYGIAGLKTHSKILLIVRREAHGIRQYVHLSTGNYNDRTAKLYSDIGLLTTDRDMAGDAAAFFNLLTGYSQEVGWTKFAISPTGIRERIVGLIEREVDASTLDQPGLIMAKVNSLHDKQVCQALYRAARAGVEIRLNVRGICCLRPGVQDVSEGIRVVSIVDRFLEHARVFYFRNGGHDEVYLSSADWMVRNLDKRLEIMFPVQEPALRRRLTEALETYFADNTKAWELLPDGTWQRVEAGGPPVRAQEVLYRDAVEAAEALQHEPLQFRPLTSPEASRRG